MSLFQLSRQLKADLLNRERAAARAMLAHYHTAYRALLDATALLTTQMEEARQAGKVIGISWLYREKRLSDLLEATAAQMRRFGAMAGPSVRAQQYAAAMAAEADARDLARAALGEAAPQVLGAWNSLPTGAVESLAGTFGPTSPVTALFDSFGPVASDGVRSALIRGVALGQGAKEIARGVSQALGVPITRALTISRTEVMRSYREASLASYEANSEVVDRWRWTATKTARTCIVCIMMDGQEFDVTTPFSSHVACRCVPVPVTKSWEELGISGVEESRPAIESGPDWFERQPEAVQQSILGPAKFAAYESGDLALTDLVGYTDDPKWGPSRYEKSLKSVAT